MNKGNKITIICLTILLMVTSACTDKKNLTGTSGQQGPIPIETTIGTQYFNNIYSYEDSLKNFNSDNLVLGKYSSNGFDNQLVCLLKFSSLVDTFYQEISNTKIVLKIRDNHDFDLIDNTTLKIGKMNIDWFESTANWQVPTDSTSWTIGDFSLINGDDFELLNDLNIFYDSEDSLAIELDNQLVEDWILQDSLNFGLALFTDDDDKFMNFYSSEHSENGPVLYFDYAETEEDSIITIQRLASHDVHIAATDNEYSIFQDNLIISNIQPIRLTMKFDIPATIFTDPLENAIADTALYLQRLTINRADLILSFDNNCAAYPIETGINIDPYLVTTDSLDTSQEPLLTEDDIQDIYISSSYDSLNSAAFKINITSIVQAFTSGTYDNFGIMLRSLHEGNDLKHTEFFYDQTDPDNQNNPKVRIIFTPPHFE